MTDPFWWRCSCHHRGRRCLYSCPNTSEVLRPSDGRPVCRSCIRCDPQTSAGFRIPDGAVEALTATAI